VLGCPKTEADEVLRLFEVLEEAHASSPLVDAVVGLCPQGDTAPIGWLDADDAKRIGLDGVSVLAVRPDRYVGLRDDSADPAAVASYLEALTR
jgi:hypothetical protein